MKVLLNISRWLVGLLFIFSGAIKANDALGFSYKLEEYFVLFGMDWLAAIALLLAMIICVVEIIVGLALLLGIKRELVSWSLLAMILFFTWLTGFSAVTGKVTDCGCFGDAIPLTPWESFYKDLVLLVFILVIFLSRKKLQPILSIKISYRIVGAVTILVIAFMIWCYQHLPAMDFRAYKEGADIMALMNDGTAAEVEMIFIYKNKSSGETKEFKTSNIPQDGQWEYVDRKDEIIKEGEISTIHDFDIMNEDGDVITEELVSAPNHSMMIIAYDISKSDVDNFKKIALLAKEIEKHDIKTFGLSSSNYEKVENLRHEVGAAFTFYSCDATALKTIIRSNPGIVLIGNGKIIKKWHGNDTPSLEEVKSMIK